MNYKISLKEMDFLAQQLLSKQSGASLEKMKAQAKNIRKQSFSKNKEKIN